MTFESLGWDGKGKKADKKEDGKGSWENGKHLLSEPNEKLEVKLFGTADDKEVQHSGINFDKYNDIPVDTNGENVTPLEKVRISSFGLNKK
jgi:ATP-dependent RNA helicase DDX3X